MTEQHHDHQHHHHHEKIHLTVAYTGQHDFQETVAAETTFGQVKLAAMRKFGLDPAAAGHYVLQHDGADVADDKVVGSLHHEHVKLRLTLKEEPHKG
jgi:hypothetical protein